MPDSLCESAKDVGQDKPTKHFVEKYDAECGKYQDQKPAVATGNPPVAPTTPFTIGK